MQDPKVWYVHVFVEDLDRAIDFYGSTRVRGCATPTESTATHRSRQVR